VCTMMPSKIGTDKNSKLGKNSTVTIAQTIMAQVLMTEMEK